MRIILRHGYTAEASEVVLCLQMYHGERGNQGQCVGAGAGRVGGVK